MGIWEWTLYTTKDYYSNLTTKWIIGGIILTMKLITSKFKLSILKILQPWIVIQFFFPPPFNWICIYLRICIYSQGGYLNMYVGWFSLFFKESSVSILRKTLKNHHVFLSYFQLVKNQPRYQKFYKKVLAKFLQIQ